MARRALGSAFVEVLRRQARAVVRATIRTGSQAVVQVVKAETERRRTPPGAGDWAAGMALAARRRTPPGAGDWAAGMALAAGGARGYHLYRPPGVAATERLPLLVMLHGCGQSASTFARSTRMNRLAASERFLVLYVEQDPLAHPRGCWRWFDTRSGQAQIEAAIIMAGIDQVCTLYPVDARRVAVAGMSAGGCMAALLGTRYSDRFCAVVMHSGVGPGVASSSGTALRAMGGYANHGTAHDLAHGRTLPPLLIVQGLSDHVVVPTNATEAAQSWAQAAGAVADTARIAQRGKRYAMRTTDYLGKDGLAVSLCEVDSLGHAWSGGSAQQPFSDPRGPDASTMVWRFVARAMARVANAETT